MGTPIEGKSLLNKGLNAYFSFGKQVFNNNIIRLFKKSKFAANYIKKI